MNNPKEHKEFYDNLRRKINIQFLESLGIRLTKISYSYTYRELLKEYVSADIINRTETVFLKEGVLQIFDSINLIKSYPTISYEEAESNVVNRNLDVKDVSEDFIRKQTHREIIAFVESKKYALEFLNKEFADFKINLERMNVLVDIVGNEINLRDVKPTNTNSQNYNENESGLLDLIEDHFDEDTFVNDGSYERLFSALKTYFERGVIKGSKKINFIRASKMKVGWSLSTIYRIEKSQTLSYDFLLFAKENFSIFENEMISEKDFRKSNLYKYFTQNPNKHRKP